MIKFRRRSSTISVLVLLHWGNFPQITPSGFTCPTCYQHHHIPSTAESSLQLKQKLSAHCSCMQCCLRVLNPRWGNWPGGRETENVWSLQAMIVLSQTFWPGSEKPGFLKKPNTLGFGVLLDFGLYWFFWTFFYSNEQLGSLLVYLAHQLSFYLDSDSPVL